MKKIKLFIISIFLVAMAIIALNVNVFADCYYNPNNETGVNIDENLGLINMGKKTNEYEVTDSSEMSSTQPIAEVDLAITGKSIYQIKNEGYKTVVVVFELDIAEINDGYQEFFLYDSSSSNANKLVTLLTNFEHGSGYKNSDCIRYEFYAEVPVDSFKTTVFTMRFGAHGNYSDDWKFKALQVQILLSYEEQKISDLKWYEGVNTYYYE